MNFLKKIIIFITILFSFSVINKNISYSENISSLNNHLKGDTAYQGELGEGVEKLGKNIINKIIYIFGGILVILIVYSGIQMVLSKGTNDDDLTKAKRTFLYSIIGVLFILFHEEIYNALAGDGGGKGSKSYFIILGKFNDIIINLLAGVQILLAGISIFIIIYIGIMLILNSRKGDEDAFKKAKDRLKRLIIALLSIGFIELWIKFLETGNIEAPKNIFQNLANMALFLAGPIAIFFLTLAGYYYIFSRGDEEKAKKGKIIIINTSIGIIILLCSYIALNDISALNF